MQIGERVRAHCKNEHLNHKLDRRKCVIRVGKKRLRYNDLVR